jgi:hypothetical protein
VPFTRVVYTAGTDGDVTVNSILVRRTGLGSDVNLAGIVLLDDATGYQIGLEKTLNSNHEVTLNESFKVMAGQSRTMTVAGNMAAKASLKSGEILTLEVVSVNTSATVSGTLPIKGATHTVNDQLSIGTATVSVGTTDPNAAVTKNIGSTSYVFSQIKIEAGTNEKIRVRSIRWNQAGSAGNSDFANLKTRIDGVDYAMTIDATGKYYTATFGDGIVIDKGQFKEIAVRGDIISGSNRTIIFHVFKSTDLFVTGETYGFGITAAAGSTAAASTASEFTTGTPWFDGSTITIGKGSITVTKSTAVAAQNVAENTLNVALGAFDVEVKGEAISVGRTDFYFGVTGTGNALDMTQVVLADANGSVVAGPVDAAAAGTGGRARFTDSITYPVGKNTYFLKGKYGTDFANNDSVTASTTPADDWTTVTGQETGDSITPGPTSAVEGPKMTVKAPVITISVSSVPLAQTIVAGNPFVFANYQLDASDSGDDIQFTQLLMDYEVVSGVATNVSSCTLLDGTTELTTGSNRASPTASKNNQAFTLDNPLVVPKGTIKGLALRCSTTATTTGQQFRWGIDTLTNAANQATGVASGQSLTTAATNMNINASVGQIITLNTGGTYTVVDDSSPGYSIVTPGTEATLLKLKFTGTTEDIKIMKVGFQLASAATNTPVDLVDQKISLWDGTTKVGEAIFVNNGDYATSTLSGTFNVPAGGNKTLTVKGTVSAINATAGPLTNAGDLIVVAWDAQNVNSSTPVSGGNYGTGVQGGTSIAVSSTADVTPTGVRVLRAYPKFEKVDLSTSERVFQTGSNKVIYKFKVTAMNGPVAFSKFTFQHSSSTGTFAKATTSKYALYVYTDAFTTPDSTFQSATAGDNGSDGLLNSASCYGNENGQHVANTIGIAGTGIEIQTDKSATACAAGGHTAFATTTYTVPSGATRWFEFRTTIAGVETQTGTESIDIQLNGDVAYPTTLPNPNGLNGAFATAGFAMSDFEGIGLDTNNDLLWSPLSTTTTATLEALDWTNGYQVPGLPGVSMAAETLTSAN